MRALIVDDDEDTRDLMVAVLEMHGAVVSVAIGGAHALAVFDLLGPHILLTDLAMPGMDGLALVRELRRRGDLATALVLISGHSGSSDVRRALASGFDAHLTKPVEVPALVALVRELTTSHR